MDLENTEETWTGSSSRSGRKRRRRSILKAPSPARQALTDVDANRQDDTEVTATTTVDAKRERSKRRRSSKRVSFANTHEVKEFMKEKDARELGILESSVDESAIVKKRMLAQAGISSGPGHSITGLDTLLTAPIVHQTAQDVQSEPRSSAVDRPAGESANRPQPTDEAEAGRGTPRDSGESVEFNFQPQIDRGKPQCISDFFRTVVLGGTMDQPDEPQGGSTDKTILFRSDADADQGNMDMTGSYDHTIHQGVGEQGPPPPANPESGPPAGNPAVTEEMTQQIYCDKLGLLGPTYTCRIPSWDSSDSISLHGSSVHSISSLSNASYMAGGTSAKGDSIEPRDVTRVFASEDTTSNMEMTGCIPQMKKPANSSPDQAVSGEQTRVFGMDEQTGSMELTTCLGNDSNSHGLGVKDDTEGRRETDVTGQDRTMIYGRGDGRMEFTGALHTDKSMRTSTERSQRKDHTGGMMEMGSTARILDSFAPSECMEDEDKTVVCKDGFVMGDGDLTECFAVFPNGEKPPGLASELGREAQDPIPEKNLKIQIPLCRQGVGKLEDSDPKTSPDFVKQLMDSWKSAREQESSRVEANSSNRGGEEGVSTSEKDLKIQISSCGQGVGEAEESDPKTSPDFVKQLMDSWKSAREQESSRVEANSLNQSGEEGLSTSEKDLRIQISSCGQGVGEAEESDPKTSPDFVKQLMDSWKSAKEQESSRVEANSSDPGGEEGVMTSSSARNSFSSLRNERSTGIAASNISDTEHKPLADAAHLPVQKMTTDQNKDRERESSNPTPSPDFATRMINSWRAERSMTQETSKLGENSSQYIVEEDEAKARMEMISNSAKKQMSDLASHKLPGIGTSGSGSRKEEPLIDPTMTLADMSLIIANQDGPLDSTHILPNDHMGRRSAFFPSSALKTKPKEGPEPQDAPVAGKPGHWDSTTKVMEGNKRFLGSAEKAKEALDALKARALDKSQSRISKAKVGLFQEKPPRACKEEISVDSDVRSVKKSGVHSDSGVRTSHRVSGHQRSSKSTEELLSNLLDSTPGMKYSSVTLNDDLLNGTSGKQDKKRFPGPQDMKYEAVRPRTTPTNRNPADDKSQPQFASTQHEKTRHFDSENTAGMEFTKCLNADLQQIVDRDNVAPGNIPGAHLLGSSCLGGEWSLAPDEPTKRFGNGANAGMEMTTCLPSNPQSSSTKRNVHTQQVPEEHTTKFSNAYDARMEMTACLTSNLRSETEKGIASSVQAPEEHTQRFLRGDNAGMEMTACLTSNLKNRLAEKIMTPGTASVNPAGKSYIGVNAERGMTARSTSNLGNGVDKENKLLQNLSYRPTADNNGPLEEHTRRFGKEDAAGMEMTTCLTSTLRSGIDKENTPPQDVPDKAASSDCVPSEHTRRFEGEDGAGMEMTTCLTSNLPSRMDKENTPPQDVPAKSASDRFVPSEHTRRFGGLQSGMDKENTPLQGASNEAAADSFVPSEHTRRFGGDDGAAMEMTTCVTGKPESEIVRENKVTQSFSDKPIASDVADMVENTRRFGTEDAARMEMTACLTSRLQSKAGKENMVPQNITDRQTELDKITLGEAVAPEDHTRIFGDAAGMEMTTCLTSNLQNGVDKENRITSGSCHAPGDNTKRFGDAAKMEMTACLTSRLPGGVDKENRITTAAFDALEDHTRRFGDAAGMEMTTCLTSSLQSGVDKKNTPPQNAFDKSTAGSVHPPGDHTRRFGKEDAGMEMTSCLSSNLQSSGVDKENTPPQNAFDKLTAGSVDPPGEHTRRFEKEDAAAMEITTCLTSNLQSGVDKENTPPQITLGRSTAGRVNGREEHTRRFGKEDAAGMEMTTCLTSDLQSGIDKENTPPQIILGRSTAGIVNGLEEHTRRFGKEDAAEMEMTSCLTSNSPSGVDDGSTLQQTVPDTAASDSSAPGEHTRRYEGGVAASMEMTTCVTAGHLNKIGKENVNPPNSFNRAISAGFGAAEDRTRRFNGDDLAGMEMTSCLTSRLQMDRGIAATNESCSNAPEDHTRRFVDDDTAGMELTTCSTHYVESVNKDDKSLPASIPAEPSMGDNNYAVDEHSKTIREKVDARMQRRSWHDTLRMDVSVHERAPSDRLGVDETKYSGSEDDGGMEITRDQRDLNHTSHRRFGPEQAGNMELTACGGSPRQIVGRIPDKTVPSDEFGKAGWSPETSQGQDRTQLGMTERMGLTGAVSMTESSQNEIGGPPPCKKSKPDEETMSNRGTSLETDGVQPGNGIGRTASQAVKRGGECPGISDGMTRETGDMNSVSGVEEETRVTEGGKMDASQEDDGPKGDELGAEMRSDPSVSKKKRQTRRETFTLDRSAVLPPCIDGESAGSRSDDTAVGGEGGPPPFPGNIWDTNGEGIMEEEFHSPDCTEDLAGIVLGRPAMADNLDLVLEAVQQMTDPRDLSETGAVNCTPDEMETSGDGSKEGDFELIPDDLSLLQFFEMLKTRDGSPRRANFGRETLLLVDLHKPEELEDFLRLFFVTKPDQEIHDWAITQIQTNLEKFGKCFKPQESKLLQEKFPEIFKKLKDHATRQETYDALLQLHKQYVLSARNEFHEWNYRMKSSLVDGLKNDIKKMSKKTQTLSAGLTKIEQRIRDLDQGVSDIDNAVANLEATSLPTEEELEQYENNKKELSDWSREGEQQQDTVQQLEREKLDLKRRGQEQTDQIASLEAEVLDLEGTDSEKAINAHNEELAGLKEQLDALQRITEWKLESASASFHKLKFTFLCDTLDLSIEYESESGQPTKLKSVSLESYLAEGACPIAQLTHRLVLRSVDVDQLTRDHGMYAALPVMLQSITSKIISARRLVEEELRPIDWNHPLTIEDCCVQMEFHSVKAHTSFLVNFDLSSFASGQTSATVSHDIGKSRVEDVQKILERMKPGHGELTRTVRELERLLKTPSVDSYG